MAKRFQHCSKLLDNRVLPPLALYVHIPWCERKCPYCDFNSHENFSESLETPYVAALLADLDEQLASIHGRELVSIFFGGGTPSLFSGEAIGAILEGVEKRIAFARNIEITLESNPGTAEASRYQGYRAAGVNRLSMGIQSFDDGALKRLGRIHDSAQAKRAITMARDAGFERYNLDLMHGLPQQTLDGALADIRTAIELSRGHLSWYQLTIEPNTAFYSDVPVLPVEDTLADIQDEGEAILAEAGFMRYEISAFCKPGEQSRHNTNYWTFGDYLGIGAGAHGKLTGPDGVVTRTQRSRVPQHYLKGFADNSAKLTTAVIPTEDLTAEFMMNALRLTEGFPLSLYQDRTGLDGSTLLNDIKRHIDRGLLVQTGSHIAPTELGLRFLNDLLAEFV